MNVYYNKNYSNVNIEFETFKKSEHIAAKAEKFTFLKVTDPVFNDYGILSEVERIIEKYIAADYLNALKRGTPTPLAESNGLGWAPNLYNHVLNSTAGIFKAIADVNSVNGYTAAASLSSGLHHANHLGGKAFCTVNSLAIAALEFPNSVILDFDAHCGGGTFSMLKHYDKLNKVKMIDISTEPFDTYDADHRPNTMLLLDNYNDNNYLDEVSQTLIYLERSLNKPRKAVNPLLFYNAGVDIYPFISAEAVAKRDRLVAEFAKNLGARVVVLMAGGYGEYSEIAQLHLNTILNFAKN